MVQYLYVKTTVYDITTILKKQYIINNTYKTKFYIDNKCIFAEESDEKLFVKNINNQYIKNINTTIDGLRGIKIIARKDKNNESIEYNGLNNASQISLSLSGRHDDLQCYRWHQPG